MKTARCGGLPGVLHRPARGARRVPVAAQPIATRIRKNCNHPFRCHAALSWAGRHPREDLAVRRILPGAAVLPTNSLAHDPEKRTPVFGKDHAPPITARRFCTGPAARYCRARIGWPARPRARHPAADRRSDMLRLCRRARDQPGRSRLQRRAGGQRQGPVPRECLDTVGAGAAAHPCRHGLDLCLRVRAGFRAGGAAVMGARGANGEFWKGANSEWRIANRFRLRALFATRYSLFAKLP